MNEMNVPVGDGVYGVFLVVGSEPDENSYDQS